MTKASESRKAAAAQAVALPEYFIPQTRAAKAEVVRKLSPLDEMYAYFS